MAKGSEQISWKGLGITDRTCYHCHQPIKLKGSGALWFSLFPDKYVAHFQCEIVERASAPVGEAEAL